MDYELCNAYLQSLLTLSNNLEKNGTSASTSKRLALAAHVSEISSKLRSMASKEQVDISSDDSSSSDAGNDVSMVDQLNDESHVVLSDEAWLFRKAKSYQEYMKLIPIPTNRGSFIPFTSWVGLGKSIKKMYDQPLHYLTNIKLKRMDQQRHGGENENVPLDTIVHPVKAETMIWLMEDVHRKTASPDHLLKLWEADPRYHAFIDAIYPKLDK